MKKTFKMTLFKSLRKSLVAPSGIRLADASWRGISICSFAFALFAAFWCFQNADVKFADLEHLIFPECKDSVLVIINGHYRSDLSKLSGIPKRIVILPLQEAFRTYGSFLNNQWNKSLKGKDPFALLNAALFQNGLFFTCLQKRFLKLPFRFCMSHHAMRTLCW